MTMGEMVSHAIENEDPILCLHLLHLSENKGYGSSHLAKIAEHEGFDREQWFELERLAKSL